MEVPEASSHRGPEAAALRSARAIVSGVIVDIGGHPLLLRATDLHRARAMAVLLSDLPLHPGPARLKIQFDERCPPSPRRPPDQADGDFRIWRSPERLVIRHGERLGALVSGDTAEVGGDDVDIARRFRQMFSYVLAQLLAPLDRLVLHAAGLEWGGLAVLVFGGSGAGKSTTALAALAAGTRLMSDDLVVVRMDNGRPEAHGVPRPMAVPADVVDLSAADARPIPRDSRGRWEVPVDQWARGWQPVAASLLTTHARVPGSRLLPVTADRVLETVLSSFVSLSGLPGLRAWLPTAGAISRLRAWSLAHGTDAVRRSADAHRLLATVRDQLSLFPAAGKPGCQIQE